MVVIVWGVSGAGKTVTGQLLANELKWSFYDGDDFHSEANREKMQHGTALTEEDRKPWLTRVRQLIENCLAAQENAVLACSALKKKYRDSLRVTADVKFVFLRGSFAIVTEQLRHRRGHFMDRTLLQNQFDDLEEPERSEDAVIVELGRTPHEIVLEIRQKLGV